MADNREWDEYKLIQDKIDKIGDFRFRVKTWSTTLLGAFLFAGIAANLPAWIYLLPFILLGAFGLFEYHQTQWQSALQNRAKEIEGVFRRADLFADPGAVVLWKSRRPQSIGHAMSIMTADLKGETCGRYFTLCATEWFYGAQAIFILIVFAYEFFRVVPRPLPSRVEIATTRPVELQSSGPVDAVVKYDPAQEFRVRADKPLRFEAIEVKVDGLDGLRFPTTQPIQIDVVAVPPVRLSVPASQPSATNPSDSRGARH